jgi:DENN domain-containing protein 11
MLDEYWEENRIRESHDTANDADGDSPMLKSRSRNDSKLNGYRRPRGISDATALMSSHQTLSPHHPAISLPILVSDFGPLIFPLYRATLLRKRLLMVGEPPVEQNCNFGSHTAPRLVPWVSMLIHHSLRSLHPLFRPNITPLPPTS